MGLISDPDELPLQPSADRPATAPVVLAGFCAPLNLYATQPVLPLLEKVFHASHNQVTLTITAATVAVAIAYINNEIARLARRIGGIAVVLARVCRGSADSRRAPTSRVFCIPLWAMVRVAARAETCCCSVTGDCYTDFYPAGAFVGS